MPTTETIAKLNRILDGLMGVKLGLEFMSVDELTLDAWDFEDLQILAEPTDKNPAYIEDNLGSAFGFPVYLESQLTGLAVVRGWDGARPRQLILLAELITAILERRSKGQEKRETLQRIEERMIVNEEKPANVISLPNRPRVNKTEEAITTEVSAPLEISPLTTLPLLILAKPEFPMHRAAVEIHELSNRWAMVNLKDLTPDTLDSEDNLKQLGGVTLFIESLESLSTEHQIKLAEYLAGHPAPEMPQIIAGMTTTNAFGEDEAPKVLSILLDQFAHSKLDWSERKFEEITKNFIVACLEVLMEQTRESLTHGEFYLPFNVHQLDPKAPTFH